MPGAPQPSNRRDSRRPSPRRSRYKLHKFVKRPEAIKSPAARNASRKTRPQIALPSNGLPNMAHGFPWLCHAARSCSQAHKMHPRTCRDQNAVGCWRLSRSLPLCRARPLANRHAATACQAAVAANWHTPHHSICSSTWHIRAAFPETCTRTLPFCETLSLPFLQCMRPAMSNMCKGIRQKAELAVATG